MVISKRQQNKRTKPQSRHSIQIHSLLVRSDPARHGLPELLQPKHKLHQILKFARFRPNKLKIQ